MPYKDKEKERARSRQKYYRYREKYLKQQKEYYRSHREKRSNQFKLRRHKIKEIWYGEAQNLPNNQKRRRGRQAEKVAEKLLTKLGFTDILALYEWNVPFDFLARKDGKSCAIDVTTYIVKSRRANLSKKLLKWLDLKKYCLFISPDCKKFVLKEVKGGTCFLSFKDIERAKEIVL